MVNITNELESPTFECFAHVSTKQEHLIVDKSKHEFCEPYLKWPKLEQELKKWALDQENLGIPVTMRMVICEAERLAAKNRISDFVGTVNWCSKFKKRNGLKFDGRRRSIKLQAAKYEGKTSNGPQPIGNMKAMEPGAPMISVPAGVIKEFMPPTTLVNNTNEEPASPKAPSQTRTPSPDLPNQGDVSALPTDNYNPPPVMNGVQNSDSKNTDMEKSNSASDDLATSLKNLGSSITITCDNSKSAELPSDADPEKKLMNGTVGSSLKRPSDDDNRYPDLKKIRVFAGEKNKSVESKLLEFNKHLDKESKKIDESLRDSHEDKTSDDSKKEDPRQGDLMCLSSSVTITRPEDRTTSDLSDSAKSGAVNESTYSNKNSPLPNFTEIVGSNVPSVEGKSNFSETQDSGINQITTNIEKDEPSPLTQDLDVLITTTTKRESDLLKQETKRDKDIFKQETKRDKDIFKQETSKFCGKLKKMHRKELEKVILRLFSEKTLYQCELGRQKQLCEKLETTLEANRKKTAQFHKEIEDLRKVTNRLAAEQASRKGQFVAPIRIKRSVGIQAAPHIINKGLQHAQGENSTIKTISPRASVSSMKSTRNPGQMQAAAQTTFRTKMIPGNNPNMLQSGALGILSTSQPGIGRPQAALSQSVLQGTVSTTLTNATGPMGAVAHATGAVGTVRPAAGQMVMMSTPGMMQAIPRPAGGGVVYTANKTMIPVVQGKVVRSSLVPITNIISGNVLNNPRPMLIQSKEVTATSNAVSSPLVSGGRGVVDLTIDEARTAVARTSTVMPAPGTLVKVPVSATQLVAIPQPGGVVLLPNASAGTALVVSQVSGVQNVSSPVVAQARTGTVTSTPRVMGASFRPISATTTTGSSIVSQQHRHPAPLPRTPVQQISGITKKLPPQPTLKLSHKDNSIVLSWTMGKTEDHETIASYQLYAYQEGTQPPSAALWKKVGSVKALELPMACTLTQFMPGHVYHFAVRAVDIKSRLGPFSDPRSIRLEKK